MAQNPKRAPPQVDPAEGDPGKIDRQIDRSSGNKSGKEASTRGNGSERPAAPPKPDSKDGGN